MDSNYKTLPAVILVGYIINTIPKHITRHVDDHHYRTDSIKPCRFNWMPLLLYSNDIFKQNFQTILVFNSIATLLVTKIIWKMFGWFMVRYLTFTSYNRVNDIVPVGRHYSYTILISFFHNTIGVLILVF